LIDASAAHFAAFHYCFHADERFTPKPYAIARLIDIFTPLVAAFAIELSPFMPADTPFCCCHFSLLRHDDFFEFLHIYFQRLRPDIYRFHTR